MLEVNKLFEKNKIFAKLQQILPKAMCTYSQFHVAAIVVTDNGYFHGFNIENSAYPNTICAERTALFSALLNGASTIKEVHLLTDDVTGKANMCGSCRQTLSDHVAPNCIVYVYAHDGTYNKFFFYELLPEAFNNQFL
ncbi:cytidine deaminase [Mycoplasmoides fastidiosum]|uniref:Cytidine deaminase n=1 Tax=Mycoplasmoides fastidiosum TaxID=92758 RepID=A0ABU0LYN5_9BACT|nr:cytidine deaminase [Mycoplasmoides fastidiosum]MDQ0513782.1 cytidine deaminase [Mycoplasmoides fastidiosum]UUD37799.1 cytidine deaminase [Mycoplasmoides fastidiosum]